MKRHRTLIYALTGAICLVSPFQAQAETMHDAVLAALESHPGIDIAKAREDAAHEDEKEQHSDLFPEISTSATGGRIFGNNSTTRGLVVSRGEAYSWLWEGSASITQPIFNGFSTVNRIDAAKAREGAAELNLADAQQGVALHAVQAYLNVMRAKEAYNKTTSYQDRIKDYLDRIGKMVDSGAADEAEAAQAKNIQAQLENTAAEMDGQVKLALADYVEATGTMPAGELTRVDNQKDLVFKSSQDAIDYASIHHPLLLSAKKDVEAEDKEISADKGSLLPSLGSEVSYLKRDEKEEIGGEVVDARAVMHMNWAFSTGGGQLARIRKSKAERSEALARAAQTQRDIERDIRRAYAEYDTALKQKELNAKRADISQALFKTYEQQFEASKVRLLQLMQAENQLFTTQLEQINSNYRVLMAEYTTLASSGRLLDTLGVAEETDVADNVMVEKKAAAAPAEKKVKSETLTPVSAKDSLQEELLKSATVPAKSFAKESIPSAPAVPATPEFMPMPAAAPVAAVPTVPVVPEADEPGPSSVYPKEDYPKEGAGSDLYPNVPKVETVHAAEPEAVSAPVAVYPATSAYPKEPDQGSSVYPAGQ